MFYGMREEKKELKERLTRVEGEAKAQVEGLRREVEELRGAKEEAERGMHEMQERMASLEASVRTLLEKSGI
jgi:chromosome segregation ATPase